jgi:hypothetical protein
MALVLWLGGIMLMHLHGPAAAQTIAVTGLQAQVNALGRAASLPLAINGNAIYCCAAGRCRDDDHHDRIVQNTIVTREALHHHNSAHIGKP